MPTWAWFAAVGAIGGLLAGAAFVEHVSWAFYPFGLIVLAATTLLLALVAIEADGHRVAL